jgi:hypothetical protein
MPPPLKKPASAATSLGKTTKALAMRKSARDRSKDRKGTGDRERSSGCTSKDAKKESRRKDRTDSSKGEDSSPDVVSCSYDMEEGDYFLCPIFNKEEFVGTASFRCQEQVAKDDTGVYVTVKLVAAEDNNLEKVLRTFLREDNGLLHVCERTPCSECQKSSLHVQCAQRCSRRDAEHAAKLDFKEYGARYWRKVATTHYKDRTVMKQLDAAETHASDSRSKKVTGGRSLTEKAQGPSGALEDRLKGLTIPRRTWPDGKVWAAEECGRVREERGRSSGDAFLDDDREALAEEGFAVLSGARDQDTGEKPRLALSRALGRVGGRADGSLPSSRDVARLGLEGGATFGAVAEGNDLQRASCCAGLNCARGGEGASHEGAAAAGGQGCWLGTRPRRSGQTRSPLQATPPASPKADTSGRNCSDQSSSSEEDDGGCHPSSRRATTARLRWRSGEGSMVAEASREGSGAEGREEVAATLLGRKSSPTAKPNGDPCKVGSPRGRCKRSLGGRKGCGRQGCFMAACAAGSAASCYALDARQQGQRTERQEKGQEQGPREERREQGQAEGSEAVLRAARPLICWTLGPRVHEMLKDNPSRLGLFTKSWFEESYVEHGIGTDRSEEDVLPLPAPIATVEAARVAACGETGKQPRDGRPCEKCCLLGDGSELELTAGVTYWKASAVIPMGWVNAKEVAQYGPNMGPSWAQCGPTIDQK